MHPLSRYSQQKRKFIYFLRDMLEPACGFAAFISSSGLIKLNIQIFIWRLFCTEFDARKRSYYVRHENLFLLAFKESVLVC
jgi:hypothetical protein